MKLYACFFLPVLFSFAPAAQAQKSIKKNRLAGIDTALNRVLKDTYAAGFAVAVVEKNQVIYSRGFGYKDYEKKLPVTPSTLFAIGSCTKAFTASLLGMLQQEGTLDLDKPVQHYLPGIKFYNDELTSRITLRDMMCHRTGLPRHDYSWYLFTSAVRDSLVQRIQYLEPSAALREKWQYNNFMFMLQGVVAEKITGKTWEENIRQRIFAPLGMNSSNLSIDEMIKQPDISLGYTVKKDSIIHAMDYYHIDAMGPAGSINSNVLDMAKWAGAWLNAGKWNGKEIIPAAYIEQAMSAQMVVSGGMPGKENPDLHFSNYGFGWLVSSYRGHYRVQHGGNIDGFSANTCLYPSDSIAIIVLCNQNNSVLPTIVRNIISDRLLNLKYIDWETDQQRSVVSARKTAREAEKVKSSSRKTGTHPSHELKGYEGVYSNKGYGSFEVVSRNDSLFVHFGHHLWWLRHYHYDSFEPFEKAKSDGYDTTDQSEPIQFSMNTAGDIETAMVNFEPTIKPIQFTKTVKAKPLARDSLLQYTGEYLLGSVSLKVEIKGEANLYLIVPGQPEYELIPIDINKFSIKILSGFTVQFNTDSKGRITELLSIQPNGTFKATRKNNP
jgi:CubicO group peptidase (beta-lactamase class C family)